MTQALNGRSAIRMIGRFGPGLVFAAVLLAVASRLALPGTAAPAAHVIPAAAEQGGPDAALVTGQDSHTEVAILAGGCFWGVQGVFQHVKGVTTAVSGYAGGDKATAQYQTVGGGRTGHAEAVRVTFDPRQISYGHILQIYFSVAHDPTELDRQGPDIGNQYRSAIFPADGEQAKIAKSYIGQLNQAHVFDAAIVTRIEPGKKFFPAEDYHQDFMTRHPTHPYIANYDLPKIDDLKRIFPDLYRADPILVANARATD
jgi:peptide-methionine (S)-S-oxide reductase